MPFSLTGIIVKGLCLAGAVACYVLLSFFHDDIFTPFEKLVICAVFAGFLVLYIAFFFSLVLCNEVDSDLNTAWALYGTAAYLGTACLCFIHFQGRKEKQAEYGFWTGIMALIQAGILLIDVIHLQICSY